MRVRGTSVSLFGGGCRSRRRFVGRGSRGWRERKAVTGGGWSPSVCLAGFAAAIVSPPPSPKKKQGSQVREREPATVPARDSASLAPLTAIQCRDGRSSSLPTPFIGIRFRSLVPVFSVPFVTRSSGRTTEEETAPPCCCGNENDAARKEKHGTSSPGESWLQIVTLFG
jgi:hypothetical protein